MLDLLGEHQVLCLSRDPGRLPRREGIEVMAADIGHGGDWVDGISRFQPEWCFHLAWEGLPDYSPDRCRANLDAGIRLLTVAAQSGVKRIVVAGTCWEYGAASGAVSETSAPGEVGTFAATKHALLAALDRAAREWAFDYRWARVFFVYGAGQRPTSLIPHLRTAYKTGGAPDIREPGSVQDFVHVDDVASALVALGASNVASGIFNVGSGEPASVGHVANRVAEYYGRARPFPSVPDGGGFWADTDKLRASTDWRCRIGIDDGISRTLATLDGADRT